MGLAAAHPDRVLGFQDETWWSRLAQPAMHTWTEPDRPLHLVEQDGDSRTSAGVAPDDPDPKALACYGVLRPDTGAVWLRFVDGRPVSAITTQFLAWVADGLAAEGKKALLPLWDDAPWHISREVKGWLRAYNRAVKQSGRGVRIIACPLPIKSPWLNNIEPHWVHGKRSVAAPDRLLPASELADRVCHYFGCPHEDHLAIPANVA
jgi:hypothetical protein